MNAGLIQVSIFLINTLFSLYITAVMLRFLLQWVKADFYNPLCQFLMKITNPLLLPLRRIIPGWFGLDMAAVALMLMLQIIEIALLDWIVSMPISGLIVIIALIKLVISLLSLYFYLILVRAVLSWISPQQNTPMQYLLWQLTEPVMRPARRIIKPIHGFDLSPILVLILIQALLILIRSNV
ncbi:MAG: YggT family protein [Gammaproteobacteria bacterium]|nr:YggT family protein [Gammaproteobacteria bacterium]